MAIKNKEEYGGCWTYPREVIDEALESTDSAIEEIQDDITELTEDMEDITVTDLTENLIAPGYSDLTFPVTAGQHCTHLGKYYYANQDIASSESWTAAHWTETTVGAENSELKSGLNNIDEVLNIVDAPSATKTFSNTEETFLSNISLVSGDKITLTIPSAISKGIYLRVYDSNNDRIVNQSMSAGNTSYTYNVSLTLSNVTIKLYTSATYDVTATVSITYGTPAVNKISEIEGKIGTLSNLETTVKSNLVGAINEVLSEIPTKSEEVASQLIDDDYMDYSFNARYNASDATIGKYVNPGTGNLGDNATAFVTDYLPIRTGETLYCYRVGTMEEKLIKQYACYDQDKNYVANSGGSDVYSVSHSGTIAYVRMSFAYNSTYYSQTPNGIFIVPTDKPWFCQQIDADPTIKADFLPRETVYVYSTDTEQQVIEKFVNAYKRGNCDIQIERAYYAFGTVLPNVKTLYGLNENEIPIGNGCRYYFNGATFEASIDLDTLGSDFYCNLLGTQRFPSSFEMYDGILISTDTRYVVHDEASAYSATYRRLYKNMTMHYITDARTDSNRKCLGGGTGLNGVVDIEGCKFITEGTGLVQDASYHGIIDDTSTAEFSVTVTNSWFSKNFAVSDKGTNQTARVMFTGNSTSANLINNGWDATAFLNEVRS